MRLQARSYLWRARPRYYEAHRAMNTTLATRGVRTYEYSKCTGAYLAPVGVFRG